MTAPWICRPCDMLCIDREHYARHLAGDHSVTTPEERARLRAEFARRRGPQSAQ